MRSRSRGVVLASLLAVAPLLAQSGGAARDSLRDAFADVNGVRLHYRIGGRGPALVLLHGLTFSGAWWDSLAPELLTDHTVIVPDLRGHGRSTNPSGVFRHPEIATDILSVLDQLQIRNFSVLGHSTGAGVSLHLAARVPDRVQAMMLIGLGHRITDEARASWVRYPPFDSLPARYREYYLRIHPGGRPQVDQLLGYLRHLADSTEDLNLPRTMIARIKAPAMIIFGDRDRHPVEIATELYRMLPKAQLWIVPSTGHLPVWTDWGGNPVAAAAFPAVVKSFFTVPQRGAGAEIRTCSTCLGKPR